MDSAVGWVSIWLTRTPLLFLVVAVMAFSIGLVCFTHSSDQGGWVQTTTTIFTSVTSLALLAVAIWFAFERWAFSRTKGRQWLWDIVNDHHRVFMERTGMAWLSKKTKEYSGRWAKKLGRARTRVYEVSERVAAIVSTTAVNMNGGSVSENGTIGDGDSDNGGNVLPLHSPAYLNGGHIRKISDASMISTHSRGIVIATPTTPTILENRAVICASPTQEDTPTSILSIGNSPTTDTHITLESPTESPAAISPAKRRFQDLTRRVIRSQALNKPDSSKGFGSLFLSSPQIQRQPSVASAPESGPVINTSGRSHSHHHHRHHHHGTSDGSERLAVRPPRVTFLIPALRKLTATQYLDAHQGLVRHLQFSPDGKWLATCSWDRTAIIWKVGEPYVVHKMLGHGNTGFVGQVAWSPNGTYLLTKLFRGVKVWAADVSLTDVLLYAWSAHNSSGLRLEWW